MWLPHREEAMVLQPQGMGFRGAGGKAPGSVRKGCGGRGPQAQGAAGEKMRVWN